MRSAIRRRRGESEEESVFISMTDMTVSFLFIVMILLAFFASQFRPEDVVPKSELEDAIRKYEEAVLKYKDADRQLNDARVTIDKQNFQIAELEDEVAFLQRKIELLEARKLNAVEEYAKAADEARKRIVDQLKEKVQEAFPNVEVSISESGDILRFSGDSFFAKNKATIDNPRIRLVVHALARGLDELLPCFTLGEHSAWNALCNPDAVLVDAVQIEGHTDSDGPPANNLRLSLARGASTFLEAEGHRPVLLKYLNLEKQPVMSVSGYGETRPIAPNVSSAGKSLNRRIDLRLIMVSAGDTDEVLLIRDRLEDAAISAWQEGEKQ